MTTSNVDALPQIYLDDLVSSFGWQNQPLVTSFSKYRVYKERIQNTERAMDIGFAVVNPKSEKKRI